MDFAHKNRKKRKMLNNASEDTSLLESHANQESKMLIPGSEVCDDSDNSIEIVSECELKKSRKGRNKLSKTPMTKLQKQVHQQLKEYGIEDLEDMTFKEKQELVKTLAMSVEETAQPEHPKASFCPNKEASSEHSKASFCPSKETSSEHPKASLCPSKETSSEHPKAPLCPSKETSSEHPKAPLCPSKVAASQHPKASLCPSKEESSDNDSEMTQPPDDDGYCYQDSGNNSTEKVLEETGIVSPKQTDECFKSAPQPRSHKIQEQGEVIICERQLKRKYRRTQVNNRDYLLLFAPKVVNTEMLIILLDIYHAKLKNAQSKCVSNISWGDSVGPGKHHQNTIDACKRGRHIYDLFNLEDADVASYHKQEDHGSQQLILDGVTTTVPESDEEVEEILGLKCEVIPSASQIESHGIKDTSPDIFDFETSSSDQSVTMGRKKERRKKNKVITDIPCKRQLRSKAVTDVTITSTAPSIELNNKESNKQQSESCHPYRPNSCPVISETDICVPITPSEIDDGSLDGGYETFVDNHKRIPNICLSPSSKSCTGTADTEDIFIIEDGISQRSGHSEMSTYSSILNSQGDIYCTQLPDHVKKSRIRKHDLRTYRKSCVLDGKRVEENRCEVYTDGDTKHGMSFHVGRKNSPQKQMKKRSVDNSPTSSTSSLCLHFEASVSPQEETDSKEPEHSMSVEKSHNFEINQDSSEKIDVECIHVNEGQTDSSKDIRNVEKDFFQNSHNTHNKQETLWMSDNATNSIPPLEKEDESEDTDVIQRETVLISASDGPIGLDTEEISSVATRKHTSRKRSLSRSGKKADKSVDEKKPKINTFACPLCTKSFPQSDIEAHASECQGLSEDEVLDIKQENEETKRNKNSPLVNKKDDFSTTLKEESTPLRTGKLLDRSCYSECYVCGLEFPEGKLYDSHLKKCLRKATRAQEEMDSRDVFEIENSGKRSRQSRNVNM